MTSSSGRGTSEAESVRRDAEVEAREREATRRLRQALAFGVIGYPAFGVLDLSVAAQTDVQLWRLVLPRLAMTGLIALSWWWVSRQQRLSTRAVLTVEQAMYTLTGISISVMALSYRGLGSPYLMGVCLILTGRTFAVSLPWKQGALLAIAPTLLPPLSLAAMVWWFEGAAPFRDPEVMLAFSLHLFFIIGTAMLMVAGGQVVDSLRSEVSANKDIGRYRLRRRVGQGGMGEVWAAWHQSLHREVALKLVRQSTRAPLMAARFEREVRATTLLTHPNTIRVFDYGVTEAGVLYYAMELLHGETLAQLVAREGPLQSIRVVYLLTQAARAVAEAHGRGIVHRDLKPENLFVTAAGAEADFIKVLDFGVARFEEDDQSLTAGDVVVGTVRYMAPEVARGQEAKPLADVWALGAIAYFALTGRAPFEGASKAAELSALLDVTQTARLPANVASQALTEVIDRALSRDASARFPTAAHFVEALEQLPETGEWRPRKVSLEAVAPVDDEGGAGADLATGPNTSQAEVATGEVAVKPLDV